MNKYFVFVALVLALAVASASAAPEFEDAESQFSLLPTDEEETASLIGKTAAFSDFCTSTRDYVIGNIKSRTRGMAATLFNVFFNGADRLGRESMNVQEAVDKLGDQIRNPDAPIAEPAADAANDVERIVAEGKRKIQESSSPPMAIFHAFVTVGEAAKNAITSRVTNQLESLRANIGMDPFARAMINACNMLTEYDYEIHSRFEAARDDLSAADTNFASVQFEQVNCVTAKRVARAVGICKLAISAHAPLIKAYKGQ